MENSKIMHYILIFAAAFVMLSFGIWELINPGYWAGFVPSFLSPLNILLLVRIHGAVLTILGLWFLSGKKIKLASIIGAIILLEIVVDSKEGDVSINGEDSYNVYVTKLIVLAISRGFNPDIAILLLIIALYFDEHSS